jgi:hypothetical protein
MCSASCADVCGIHADVSLNSVKAKQIDQTLGVSLLTVH